MTTAYHSVAGPCCDAEGIAAASGLFQTDAKSALFRDAADARYTLAGFGNHLQRRVILMITGAHTIIFSEDATAVRAFFRDVLRLPSVDAGEGWLIFGLPPAELAAHPIDDGSAMRHELFLMCDDIHKSVEELKARGVEFTADISDQGWGILTSFRIPGGGQVALYQPRHARPAAPISKSTPAWLETKRRPRKAKKTSRKPIKKMPRKRKVQKKKTSARRRKR